MRQSNSPWYATERSWRRWQAALWAAVTSLAMLLPATVFADDRDADGIDDERDACPELAEDNDDFVDTDGCPDRDNDRDGITDGRDECPLAAEDFDDFADDDGCPEGDNDLDGVADLQDRCPGEREDFDGWIDEDGCPDLDHDNDGFLAEVDGCPFDAESVNGFNDEDGCPDVVPALERAATGVPAASGGHVGVAGQPAGVSPVDAPRVIERPAAVQPQGVASAPVEVVPTCQELSVELDERIYFERGSALVQPAAHPELNALAAQLQAHPEIVTVMIEGHTAEDEVDTSAELSQQRANAVRAYLIERGVAADRLIGRGFGDLHPTANNDEAEGRALNRRVVFDIVVPRGCSG